ncbi:Gypsy retrotransposon integrase-like protein 1 [Marasmius tenuissimus]|uniref:Gypsy retrotransposon integrase-like protein 1 n=1 Tax=Marasmius tenuissimus TaxID=585030 RepID=A0ABR3A6Q8_9AGAR
MILLVNIWRPHQSPKHIQESEKDMAAVYRSLELLQKYENRSDITFANVGYPMAGCVRDMLNIVIAVGQSPKARESLKRSRLEGDFECPPRSVPCPPWTTDKHLPVDHPRGFADFLGTESFERSDDVASIDPVFGPQAFGSSQDYRHGALGLESSFDFNRSNLQEPTGAEGLLTDNLLVDSDFLCSNLMPVSAENLDFTFTNQEDWNLFMSGVDDILSGGAAEYVTQSF